MTSIKEGFYKVEFHAALPGTGGIVIIEGSKVRGGDDQCLYSGVFAGEASNLSAEITVSAFSSQAKTVFGTVGGKFQLKLSGNSAGDSFQFSGPSPVPGSTGITIKASWIAPLSL